MKAAQMDQAAAVDQPRPAAGDLALALLGGLALLGLVLLARALPAPAPWLLALRLPLGLLYVLFVPGYLLQAALFPRRDDLDGLERAGLSLGLSAALVPLLALLLDRLPWGLGLWPIVLGQVGLVLALLLAALLSRLALPREQAYAPRLRFAPRIWWRGLPAPDRRLFLLAGAALLLALGTAAWVFLLPSEAEFMTEFYLLGKGGLAEDFPRQAQVGEPLQVTLGIRSLERESHIYRVEAYALDPWVDGQRQPVAMTWPAAFSPGESQEWPIEWSMPWEGDDQQVEFLLFIDAQPEPYRRLVLWLDVTG